MKKIFFIISLFAWTAMNAQNKPARPAGREEKEVIARAYLLSHTVFGTKDSSTLEDLFAKTATYGHSHGKIQNRQEAIDGATHNQSFYTDTAVSNIRHLCK